MADDNISAAPGRGPKTASEEKMSEKISEKKINDDDAIEVASITANSIIEDAAKPYIPADDEVVIDPRLIDYPIPLVAKTVDLHNDFDEPILTFRFWLLTTFWVVVGCAISTLYYFKPYYQDLGSFTVQLLSWGMGDAMARYLPTRKFSIFGWQFSMNPGPWNAKEHALIVVAYWGSCYTAYGLGPLSALELYYDRKINPGWGICFLLTSQMLGYGFVGLFRDILVRPPKIFYPGVLPNVQLFNAMHKNPSVTSKSIKFFAIVGCATFCYQWLPSMLFPMLSSLPVLCYMAHGNWKGFLAGSGYYGFGILDFSLDWNYISFFSPLYIPLWSNASQIGGALIACWLIYPILYFCNVLGAQTYPPMSSDTFDTTGNSYDVSAVLTPQYTLNQTAMDAYSQPRWSTSYAMNFFFGFACSTGAILYSILFYGKDSYQAVVNAWKNRRSDYDDPYLKLMSRTARVPHWWYLVILGLCMALSIGCLYGADLGLPWWGFIVICIISIICTFPNGILYGIAGMQVGMSYLAEILSGAMFSGNPSAVLACIVYSSQLLVQNINLTSDYKFGFYMKIPEKHMFVAQIYGTLLGPFINYGVMRLVIDKIGKDVLVGNVASNAWDALQTRNYYSLSVIWGIIGPKVLFAKGSEYNWIYYAFFIGPALVGLVYIVHHFKPHWELETRFNPVVIMYGATLFPVYQTTNLMTSGLLAMFFMGYMLRYHPAWFRKYNYLLGIGLDSGTQICSTVIMFAINLTNTAMPYWWGNNAIAIDRCFPPADLPINALND
ncbi:hypothetical protein SEUCBS139899_002857 [Sporothrix eucalyptigena]|uniref:Oligopeptide transporter 6 n=1 Tax=Sporothrix eucalyptigena TaxID=1812306 RepID=A0ABP0BWZ7_9PEZI